MENQLAFHICRRAYAMALAMGMPILRRHQRKRILLGKENPDRILEREGLASEPRPDGNLVWFHGASVGEALAALPVIKEILTERENTWAIITTGTVTSAKILQPRLPDKTIHQFAPLDRPNWVSSFLDHWRPDAAIWIESEFWPNTLWAIHERGIPLILLNGRVSLRSFRRWQWVPVIARGLLSCFDLCLAQSDEDASRLQILGAKSVKNTGNIKLGAPPLPYDGDELRQLASSLADRPTWLVSSTHPGEEKIAEQVHKAIAARVSNLLTIIVPRHPDRGSAISTQLRNQGLIVTQRSVQPEITIDTQVYVADTIGELGLFFRLCRVVFMGKSLISPGGGQNPYEAARIGCSVIFGPYMSNFLELSENMVADGAAIQIPNIKGLEAEVLKQLQNPVIVDQHIAAAEVFCSQFDMTIRKSVQEILNAWPIDTPSVTHCPAQ